MFVLGMYLQCVCGASDCLNHWQNLFDKISILFGHLSATKPQQAIRKLIIEISPNFVNNDTKNSTKMCILIIMSTCLHCG